MALRRLVAGRALDFDEELCSICICICMYLYKRYVGDPNICTCYIAPVQNPVCFSVLLFLFPASHSCNFLGEWGWSLRDHCVYVIRVERAYGRLGSRLVFSVCSYWLARQIEYSRIASTL